MTRTGDRKGKFIAVANMKGGVGKTTTVVSLAETLAADDQSKKVLVIDLDPQASASVMIAGDDELSRLIDAGRTFENFVHQHLLQQDSPAAPLDGLIHDAICGTTHRNRQLAVSLLPCGPRLRLIEKLITLERGRAGFNLNAIDEEVDDLSLRHIMPMARDYDYIVFDCAPGISRITEVAIRRCDLALIPTVPDRISVYGLNAIHQELWCSCPTPKSRPHIIIVRLDNRIRQHKEVFEALRKGAAAKDAAYHLLKAQIPTSAPLVAALVRDDMPTFSQKYTPDVIHSILNPLAREVKELLR